MNTLSILDHLRDQAANLRYSFGVADLAVFGSVARGEADEANDGESLMTLYY